MERLKIGNSYNENETFDEKNDFKKIGIFERKPKADLE